MYTYIHINIHTYIHINIYMYTTPNYFMIKNSVIKRKIKVLTLN